MTINTEHRPSIRHGLAVRWAAAAAVVVVAAIAVRALAGADSPAPDDAAATAAPPSTIPQSAERSDRTTGGDMAPQTTELKGQYLDDTVAAVADCDMGEGPADPLQAAMQDLFADGTLDCDPFLLADDTDSGMPTTGDAGGMVPLDFDLPEGWAAEQTDEGLAGFLSPDGSAIVYGDAHQYGGSLEDFATAQLHGVMDIAADVEHMRLVPDRFLGKDALRADVEYTLADGGQLTEQAFMFEHGDHAVIVGIALEATDPDSDAARFTRLREVLETVELPA